MQQTNERKTNGRLYKLTIVTVFAALVREVPMGYKNAVLLELFAKKKNKTVNYLTYKENTREPYNDNFCPFRALTLHLHGNGGLEETSKRFKVFPENAGGSVPAGLQGVSLNDVPMAKSSVQVTNFLFDIEKRCGWSIDWRARQEKSCETFNTV